MPTFGEVLLRARKNKNIKQKEAADALQLKQSTYSKYENDEMKGIPINLVKRICVLFEIDANMLFLSSNIEEGFNCIEKEMLYKKSGIHQEYIIEQLVICLDKTEKMNNKELNKVLEKIKLTNTEQIFSIWYDNRIKYTINKDNMGNYLGLCSIVSIIVSNMITKIKEIEGFDAELLSLRVQYENLLVYFLKE